MYYLDITFLPRSSINRNLSFTDFSTCFQFSVKTVLFDFVFSQMSYEICIFCLILPFYFCTNSKFSYSFIAKNDISNEIENLHTSTATQDSDVPTKLIKNNLRFIC